MDHAYTHSARSLDQRKRGNMFHDMPRPGDTINVEETMDTVKLTPKSYPGGIDPTAIPALIAAADLAVRTMGDVLISAERANIGNSDVDALRAMRQDLRAALATCRGEK